MATFLIFDESYMAQTTVGEEAQGESRMLHSRRLLHEASDPVAAVAALGRTGTFIVYAVGDAQVIQGERPETPPIRYTVIRRPVRSA